MEAHHENPLSQLENLHIQQEEKQAQHEEDNHEVMNPLQNKVEKQVQDQDQDEEEFVTQDLVEYVKEITSYEFNDPKLLQEAFTDSSCGENSSYERLEYVGDSVLNFLVSKEHYLLYPDLAPGKLTRLRAANVDTEKLARVAVKHNLYKFLRHKKPLLSVQIQEFKNGILEYPLHSMGLVETPKVLADIFESLIGAIFIDSNSSIDTTWQIVKNLLQPLITPATLQVHPATKLHEMCQKSGKKVEVIDLWEETGGIEIFVNGEFAGSGHYRSKKLIALNRAADDAYNLIVKKSSIVD